MGTGDGPVARAAGLGTDECLTAELVWYGDLEKVSRRRGVEVYPSRVVSVDSGFDWRTRKGFG